MTVEALKKALNELPSDAIITVCNDDLFVDGEYVATSVGFDRESNTVLIGTDHEELLD